jgi:hypothetical protein
MSGLITVRSTEKKVGLGHSVIPTASRGTPPKVIVMSDPITTIGNTISAELGHCAVVLPTLGDTPTEVITMSGLITVRSTVRSTEKKVGLGHSVIPTASRDTTSKVKDVSTPSPQQVS